MPVVSSHPKAGQTLFELTPNASMTKSQYKGICIGVAIFSVIVVLRFLTIGAWLIVPFTLLDAIFIIVIFRMVRHSNTIIEKIYCSSEDLLVLREKGGKRLHWQFNPYWAKVVIKKIRHPWYSSRLLIRSHGEAVEIGRFLMEEEKQKLAHDIVLACKSAS